MDAKRCKGKGFKKCGSNQWTRIGVISAQKGTYLFQCDTCGRVIIIVGDTIPLTENPLEFI